MTLIVTHINKYDWALQIKSNTTSYRKVRIAASAVSNQPPPRPQRRPTGFVRPSDLGELGDDEGPRQSVLQRLYDEVTYDDDEAGPTLKDYR